EDDELVAREVEVDVAEVVLPGAPDDDGGVVHCVSIPDCEGYPSRPCGEPALPAALASQLPYYTDVPKVWQGGVSAAQRHLDDGVEPHLVKQLPDRRHLLGRQFAAVPVPPAAPVGGRLPGDDVRLGQVAQAEALQPGDQPLQPEPAPAGGLAGVERRPECAG